MVQNKNSETLSIQNSVIDIKSIEVHRSHNSAKESQAKFLSPHFCQSSLSSIYCMLCLIDNAFLLKQEKFLLFLANKPKLERVVLILLRQL